MLGEPYPNIKCIMELYLSKGKVDRCLYCDSYDIFISWLIQCFWNHWICNFYSSSII